MGKGFFNHSSSNKKQLLDIDGNNLSISGGNTVQLPGGANFNGFFPNGVEFVGSPRDFLASDAGKLIVALPSGDNPDLIMLTVPETGLPFKDGDYFGIVGNCELILEDKYRFYGDGDFTLISIIDVGGGFLMSAVVSGGTIIDNNNKTIKNNFRYLSDNIPPFENKTLFEIRESDINNAPAESQISFIVDISKRGRFLERLIIGQLPIPMSAGNFFDNEDLFDLLSNFKIEIGFITTMEPNVGEFVSGGVLLEHITQCPFSQMYDWSDFDNTGRDFIKSRINYWDKAIRVTLDFDKGSGEVNPQNFTDIGFYIKSILGNVGEYITH